MLTDSRKPDTPRPSRPANLLASRRACSPPAGREARAIAALGAVLALTALSPVALAAQQHGGHHHGDRYEKDRYRHDHRRPHVELGAGFAVLSPQGDFATFVDDGYGVGLNATVGLDRSNVVGLRFDLGYLNYGSERFGVPVFPNTGRILADLVTRNNIGYAGLGPQIQLPYGPVRPYVNGFVGLGYFFTESSVRGGYPYDYIGYGRTLNFDDVSFAYGAGGGLGVRLGHGRTPVFLKLDAQYRRHGETEYLVPGSIIDDGDGGAFIQPLFSQVDFLLFQVGVSVGL